MALETKKAKFIEEGKEVKIFPQGSNAPKVGTTDGGLPVGAIVSGGAQAVLMTTLIEIARQCRELMNLHKQLANQQLDVLVHQKEDGSYDGLLIGMSNATMSAANAQANQAIAQGWSSIAGGVMGVGGALYSTGALSGLRQSFSKTYQSPETKLNLADKTLQKFQEMDKATLANAKPTDNTLSNQPQPVSNARELFKESSINNGFQGSKIKDEYKNQISKAAKDPEFRRELQTRMQQAQSEVDLLRREIADRPVKTNLMMNITDGFSKGASSMAVAEYEKERGTHQAKAELYRSMSSLAQEAEQAASQKASEAFSELNQHIQGMIQAMMAAAQNV